MDRIVSPSFTHACHTVYLFNLKATLNGLNRWIHQFICTHIQTTWTLFHMPATRRGPLIIHSHTIKRGAKSCKWAGWSPHVFSRPPWFLNFNTSKSNKQTNKHNCAQIAAPRTEPWMNIRDRCIIECAPTLCEIALFRLQCDVSKMRTCVCVIMLTSLNHVIMKTVQEIIVISSESSFWTVESFDWCPKMFWINCLMSVWIVKV